LYKYHNHIKKHFCLFHSQYNSQYELLVPKKAEVVPPPPPPPVEKKEDGDEKPEEE
jgi:hypothetical protein